MKVFVILDKEVGPAIRKYHHEGHVWVVESDLNTGFVKRFWPSTEYCTSEFVHYHFYSPR